MTNRFSSIAFLTVEPVLQAVYDHPFTVETIDGTLPPEKFIFYLQQDKLFLTTYARALAIAGSKMDNSKDAALMVHFAAQGLTTARELHKFYFKEYRIPPAEGPEPACHAYCAHVLERTALGSAAEGIAALLPCLWMHRKVGNHIRRLSDLDNPYFRWIEEYSSADYSVLVDKAVELCDRLASGAGEDEGRRMFAGFITSSRYEFCFCDDAYNQRSWPI